VKVPHIQELTKSDLDDLRREIHIMATNPHPNIMRFMGACTVPGRFRIVMELLDGDLEHLILGGPGHKLSLYTRLKMAKEAALGMNWLHCSDPAIIHRDLKLENLMYRQIEGQYNVVVCDFGLSVIKPKAQKTLTAAAKGTPLTRAPEIMEGRPFNCKADVYSFGMCVWEITTTKDLFPHHSDYNEFKHAICVDGERPPLPSDMLPSLKDFMEACWAKNPDDRPDFGEITNRLDEIMIDAAIPGEGGRELWKSCFLREHEIKWPKFVTMFYRYLGLRRPHDTGEREVSETVGKYRALKALVAKPKTDCDNSLFVEIQHFGNIVEWFAPLERAVVGEENILDRMLDICSKPWFHGDISLAETQRRLKVSNKEGTFLVRFSSVPGAFTITRISEGGVVKNVRISRNEDYQFYVNDEATYPNLEALIVNLQEQLNLNFPCFGSRFEDLGWKEPPSEYEVVA